MIYASVFLTELWPEDNLWRRGLEEGAHDALEARSKIRQGKAEKEKAPAPSKTAAKRKKPKASKAVKARAARFEAAAGAAA